MALAEGLNLREITTRCPSCGRRRYLQVDAWSGTTDAEIRREPFCRRCRRGGRTGIGPLLLGIALVTAPVAGVVETLLR